MAFEKVTVPTDSSFGYTHVAERDAAEAVRRAIPADARIGYWTAPDGWALRRFDWPADTVSRRSRGAVLFQTGRGDIFEKYLETFAHLHAHGWSVTAFDWRGQGGSGRLSEDPHVGHVGDYAIYDRDLAAFWSDWVAERGVASQPPVIPRVIVGHSMGGMMVVRALAARSIQADAAILVAPMIGLKSPVGAGIAGRVARWMASRGNPARGAWRSNERPGSIASRQSLLTHDASRYDDERWWQAEGPALCLGPPSWSWLAQGFAAAAALAVDPRIEAMETPVLMLVAEADKLVDPHAALRLGARLPDAQIVRFGRESAHEILREADGVRDRALGAIDSFLDAVVPPRP
ncbi:lysophospholipase [Sphingomonas sp. PP-F2F-A104-K0414]|uniref:alpha/beta fold hydrolase n=1 Tax=Sphingomonas sp. PP-F2F-A104-K0414 TaxID=2135661 RepID=UPI001045EC20|nr:alpha/beta hydrolase [Sphingomonas sp. PP-F2F-A104-K0414]TCP99985.1 lysophospholipase [Sphingomonas sp. PP-F2F-A104-K0414]